MISGIRGQSGHPTFVSRLVAQVHSLNTVQITVQILLGHSHIDHVSPYLNVSLHEQREAVPVIESGGESD